MCTKCPLAKSSQFLAQETCKTDKLNKTDENNGQVKQNRQTKYRTEEKNKLWALTRGRWRQHASQEKRSGRAATWPAETLLRSWCDTLTHEACPRIYNLVFFTIVKAHRSQKSRMTGEASSLEEWWSVNIIMIDTEMSRSAKGLEKRGPFEWFCDTWPQEPHKNQGFCTPQERALPSMCRAPSRVKDRLRWWRQPGRRLGQLPRQFYFPTPSRARVTSRQGWTFLQLRSLWSRKTVQLWKSWYSFCLLTTFTELETWPSQCWRRRSQWRVRSRGLWPKRRGAGRCRSGIGDHINSEAARQMGWN